MLTGEIRSQIDAIWNAFWSGGISNPLEVIEQITYLLFIRRLDDLQTVEELKASRLGTPVERVVFPAGKDPKKRPYEDLRWSRFKHREAKEMVEIVADHVFPFLRTLGGEGSTYAKHMKDARFTLPADKPGLLAKVVDMLDKVPMEERDTKGDLYVPDRERLALGMGLFIRESLLHLPEGARVEKLKDILEPHPDDDEKVRWLRAAVTTSVLVGDAAKNPGMVDLLVATWLSSRNFSQNDLEDVKSLSTLLIEPMLRLVSVDTVDSSVLLLAEAMIETEMPRHKDVIAAAVGRWFRLVPTDTFFHGEEAGRTEAERVARAAPESSLRDLHLRLTTPEAGKSVRTRHRLGLSVVCTHASVVEPIDLFALIAARGVTHWNLNDGEQVCVRMLLANTARSWFENEVASWEAKPDALRSAFLRDLIRYSERADLIELESRLPALQTTEWPGAISRAELQILDVTHETRETLRTAERAARLAIDPDCARPPRAWRSRLAKAAIERFGDSPNLHASRGTTLDDLDFENLEPALAAWAPEAGARIVRSFLADIPRRIAGGEESWSWSLEENAMLLTPGDRRKLLELILAAPAKESGFAHALRSGYLCVMAAGNGSERLRLLLNHPFADVEWTEFYEVLATSGDDRLRRRTIAVVREEHDPRRLKRARYFLANQGGWDSSPSDLARLIGDLSDDNSDRDAQDAARMLLRHSRIPTTTSASALRPLVRATDSLSEEAWQYAACLDIKRNPGVAGAEWIARARSAALTARHNGAEGHDDDVVVAQGIQRLAVRIEDRLTQSAFGHSEQFPEGIADEISDSAFDRCVDHLPRSGGRRRVDAGALVPILRRALKARHPAAKELWALAYPFQRSRFSVNERFVVQGLDWTLVDIHDPTNDDGLARELLRDLIFDCRSDSELISVAIGARLESLVRLTAVVNKLLDDGDETDRARARLIAGWMPENDRLRAG